MSIRRSPGTLPEVVRQHAEQRGSSTAFTFLSDGGERAESLSFEALDRRARALAGTLRARGLGGSPVLLLCPAGLDYVVALLGCFYASAIAVPAYPPTRLSMARTLPRVLAMRADCRAAAGITTAAVRPALLDARTQHPEFGTLELFDAGLPPDVAADAALVLPDTSAPALLQYTSGSTSAPKGVLLTHAQLLANLQMIVERCEWTARDIVLSWLPPYHDMGLIGGIFTPLFMGAQGVLMPPEAFIRRPRRWLEAAARHRATILPAPNFAFELCVRRIPPEERAGLDLSLWRAVHVGAEPIRAATLEAFAAAYAPHGFRREAFYPCYGMAEATLIISGGLTSAPPVMRAYAADALEQHRAVPAEEAPEGPTVTLVGCGSALRHEQIRIVDPQQRTALPPGTVGEIWVRSRSVASGYFNRPEETERTFRAFTADSGEGPFLRTGDLGFFDRGELFVTGRLKDLIIVRGLNHYPQDIERTVQGLHPALTADAGAAFAVDDPSGEQLVVVQELDKREAAEPAALLELIAQAIREQHELAAAEIVLIRRGTLAKTSSGKVQRQATKRAYLAGELERVASLRARPPAEAAAQPARRLLEGDASKRRTRSDPPTVSLKREQLIIDWLREHLAARLKLDIDAIEIDAPLARYGVDSLIAAELTEELERFLGVELPATISYDNPTIAGLARVLAGPRAAGDDPTRRRRSTAELMAESAGHADDPLAIVGMACRFPGAPDLASYWSLLRNGVDAISEVPKERWDLDALYDPEPGTPGKMCSRFGGFVERIDEFDAGFFGIAAREAARMDPQQRLFLELAWEALEDAGQSPAALAGTAAGVFVGVCTSDYAMLYGGDLQLIDADYGTGSSPSIVANRVSYVLDLKGPSETVDSACSSALVALQHACQSLRNLECELAIVGGVNAVLAPEANVFFSQARALARDGRCKTFDASADGFVRSEGGGAIVLKRLSQALADGDRVYALVVGSAVNHDGRSNGLMAPSGPAQQEVVRRALHAASISGAELDYVEAHGVGTKVADAVELRALGAVIGERPREQPLLVGSAKTNVGHLEAASGMVSLIKVALALYHEELPPHLHLRDVHPDIGIEQLPIAIPTVPAAWRRGERPRFAGVSAFGFGGTNAHVVLREAPLAAPATNRHDRPRHLLALSARSGPALRTLAQRLLAQLPSGALLSDVCFSANAGRAHFAHRLALVARDLPELQRGLGAFLAGAPAAQLQTGETRPGARTHVAFLFLEGPVAPGAGRALFDAHPQLRQALELCHEVLRPHLELPLLELLYGTGDVAARAALLARPSHGHAALIALQWALHDVLRAWGIEPIAVFGSGAAEYAAAAAAGVLRWDEAVVMAARRGLLHEGLAHGSELRVSVRTLRRELAAIDYLAPSVPFVSASLGRAFTLDEVPDAGHFGRHLYATDLPVAARDALLAEGCHVHLALGPTARFDPASLVPQASFLPSLAGAGGDDWEVLLGTLGALYTRGVTLDFRGFDAPFARRKLSLPTYPFERERHWLDFPRRSQPAAPNESMIEQPSSHPFISRMRIRAPAHGSFVRGPSGEPVDAERGEERKGGKQS